MANFMPSYIFTNAEYLENKLIEIQRKCIVEWANRYRNVSGSRRAEQCSWRKAVNGVV